MLAVTAFASNKHFGLLNTGIETKITVDREGDLKWSPPMGIATMVSVPRNERNKGWMRKKWKCGHFIGEQYTSSMILKCPYAKTNTMPSSKDKL
jgi:hypothetical protein